MLKRKPKKSQLTIFLFAYWHDERWKQFVGATVKIWDLAHNLAHFGHNVIIFLPRYHFDKIDLPFKVIEIPMLNISCLRLLSFSVILAFSLMFFFIKHPLDAVYVRRGISLIPLFFAKLRNTVLIYEVNDDPYRATQNPKVKTISHLRYLLSVKMDELFLRASDLGIVITEEIKDKILERKPDLTKSLLVIPSGSNLSLFIPLNKHECRSMVEFDDQINYICFIGSLLIYQGIDVLIEAAPYILKNHPASRFLIIGEGPMRQPWVQKVEEKALERSFSFFGEIAYDELPKYICATDVCVAPFLHSVGLSSPVKIFDYLACGRPVVASRIDGTTDIFSDSGAVKLVSPEDPKVLAKAVIELLDDMETANDMGQKGRQFMEKNFDRRVIAKRILGEVAQIIDAKYLNKSLIKL